jgi:DNA-directed RNA polymerase subunit M/transcription elongation factor TFIIS
MLTQQSPHNIDPDTGVCACDHCEYEYAFNQRNIYHRLLTQSVIPWKRLQNSFDFRNMIFWADYMTQEEESLER